MKKIILITCIFGLNFNASTELLLEDYQGKDIEYGFISDNSNNTINNDCVEKVPTSKKICNSICGAIRTGLNKFFDTNDFMEKILDKDKIIEKKIEKFRLGNKKISCFDFEVINKAVIRYSINNLFFAITARIED